jgi:hypothetical protein
VRFRRGGAESSPAAFCYNEERQGSSPGDPPMNLRLEQEKPNPSAENEKAWKAVFAKIEEFRKLEDDWDGEGSLAPSSEIINASIKLAERLRQTETPPHVEPSVNGTMHFEWGTREFSHDIEVVSPTLVVETHLKKGERLAKIVERPIDDVHRATA